MISKAFKNTEILSEMAAERGIDWQEDARLLPSGDPIAQLGLLAEKLGLPLPAAFSPGMTKEDFAKLLTENTGNG